MSEVPLYAGEGRRSGGGRREGRAREPAGPRRKRPHDAGAPPPPGSLFDNHGTVDALSLTEQVDDLGALALAAGADPAAVQAVKSRKLY